VLPLALSLGGATCGESEEDRVREALDRSFIATDASVCTDLVTDEFVESLYGKGAAGRARCREDVASDRAQSVEVPTVEVDGDRATAAVEVTGGSADGQDLIVRLVKNGAQWQLNELEGINATGEVGRALEARVRQQLEGTGLDSAAITCILDGIRADLARFDLEDFESGTPPALETRIQEATRACLEASRAAQM
jgi:hypothetical protein